jgi:tricorn protease
MPEAYVVEVDECESRRLTYFGETTTRVTGWSGDGRVIVTSAVAEPFRSRTWAYAVDRVSGRAGRLPFGPVSSVRYGPGGAVVVGVNQNRHQGAAWKRYRGGNASTLLIDRSGAGEFVPYLADLEGQLEDPMWVGGRVAFVSDHEGFGNVYSAEPDGSDLLRHTDHEEFYARCATSDGERVAYQCGGDIYVLDGLAADSQPRMIEIELSTPRSGRAEWVLRARRHLGPFSPGHKAQASAVGVRGRTFWITHRDGPARHLAGRDSVRTRMPLTFGPPGAEAVAFVTDAEGDDAIEVVRVSPQAPETTEAARDAEPRRIGAGQLGRVLWLVASPDGTMLAVATHDGRIVLIILETGELTTVDHSADGDATGITFSPDSRWLAWTSPGPPPLRQIKLARIVPAAAAAGGGASGESGVQVGGVRVEVHEATPLRFDDRDPTFTRDGKYLAFLSDRTFDPIHDAQVFDLSFVNATRPYLIALAATTPSPFAPRLEGRPRPGEDEFGPKGGGPNGPGPKGRGQRGQGLGQGQGQGQDASRSSLAPGAGADSRAITIDIDGIFERVTTIPVVPGRYRKLRAVYNGLLWLRDPPWGVLGEGRSMPAGGPLPSLIHYDIEKRRERNIADSLFDYAVSGDGRSIVVKHENRLRQQPSDERAKSSDAEDENSVDIDLARVRLTVNPPIEWLQMYDESARLMRDHYWLADMAGIDWEAIVARYRPLVERLSTRDDLSELLWDVQGELGTSHAYEVAPVPEQSGVHRLAYLGADFEPLPDGSWQVTRILPSEISVGGGRSPLTAPGVAMSVGDAIVAVDNQTLDAARGPIASLVGAAERPVLLTIRPGGGGALREVVVVPLDVERTLRYQDWVAGRRAAVHSVSDGRVGYVHVPDMISHGWAELHRDLHLEVDREALVVDLRDNGGGNTSELVLEKLSRTVRAWDMPRYKRPATYPTDAPRGPLVAIINEKAGSDGDIAAAGFRQRGLGPIVGTRTWGGVIGIDRRYSLVDGTTVTQPRYAFWLLDGVGYGLENTGAEPDVEVRLLPQDWAAGRDTQLDESIRLALAALEERPAVEPPELPTGLSLAPPPLPPRPAPGSAGSSG